MDMVARSSVVRSRVMVSEPAKEGSTVAGRAGDLRARQRQPIGARR
jgi:hypothetical protein